MRLRPFVVSLLSFAFVLGTSAQQVQPQLSWAPVPFDANEPATSGLKVLTNPQERSAALQLLDRARQNYTFYGPHTPAFTMKLNFTSNGPLQYEGQGTMQETWMGYGADRWSARIGSAETLRVAFARRMWSDNPAAPIPMRVQMARSTLLWPVVNPRPRVMLRAGAATIQGKAAMCILTSESMPLVDQPRHWVEKEYCIDPESGNLLLWSEAPGHYVVYDYTTSTEFQGHVIANDISIYEGGGRVMQIHVDSIQDASGVNADSLLPTPQLIAKGPSFGLTQPMKFPLRIPPPQGTVITNIQPVFVHATFDKNGHVIEAEPLQNANPELTAKAMEVVKNSNHGEGVAQREAFIDVEFLSGTQQAAAGH